MADSSRDDLLDILETLFRAQLRAIRHLRRSRTKPRSSATGTDGGRISGMDMVVDILRREARPLHITDILTAVHKRFGVDLDRESVVSAISKRVARHDRFIRTGPNTFALIPDPEDSK